MDMVSVFANVGDIVERAKQYTAEQNHAIIVNGMAEQRELDSLLREQDSDRRELRQKHDDQMQALTLKYRERHARIVADEA